MEITSHPKQVHQDPTLSPFLITAVTQHERWLAQDQTRQVRLLVEKLLKHEVTKVGNQAATVTTPDGEVRVTAAQIYALGRILKIVFDSKEFVLQAHKLEMIKPMANDGLQQVIK